MAQSETSESSFDGEIRIRGVDRVFKPRRILVVLLVPLSMSLIAVSSVNVALTTIGTGLHASDSDLQWVLSGYALVTGITLVPAGRLGDLFGRGLLFQVGLFAFVLGSILSGLATDPLFLNVARIIQGIGGGLFSPQIMGIIQQTFSGHARAKAFGLFGMVVAISVAIGPVLAGLLITLIGQDVGWRYVFFLNVPFGLIGFVLAFIWLPFAREREWIAKRRAIRVAKKTNSPLPTSEKAIPDLDPVGALLLVVAVVGIMYPFTARQVRWELFAIFVLSNLLLFGWWKWEEFYTKRGKYPMVDLQLLKIPSFSMGTIVAGAYFFGSTTTYTIIALYLQMGLKESAMVAGVISLPSSLLSAVAARWAAGHALETGRKIVQVSIAIMVLGSVTTVIVVALVSSGTVSFWWLLLTLGVFGIGQGAFGAVNQTLALQDVPVQHGGTAGGVKQTVERISTAIGNAIMTAILFASVPAFGFHKAVELAFIGIIVAQMFAFLVGYLDLRRARKL